MADVSGKGIPAAIFMAVSRTLIRTIGMQGYSSAVSINKSNDLLCAESVDSMFVTVFYAIYNIYTGELEYCNAGHNSPYIIRADGKVEVMPMSTNFMVGIVSGHEFSSDKIQLQPGDTLVMYTDGVNEAFNTSFEEYGEERMAQLLGSQNGRSCREMIDSQLEDVRRFSEGAEQSDDITILALKRKV